MRFRIVIAVGIAAGVLLALASAYTLDFGSIPPSFTARESPTYTAGTQLEVTSPVEPYYRSAVDVPVVTPPAEGEEEPTTTLSVEQEPAVTPVVIAANYFPYVIEGDEVRALRENLYGRLDGEIQATAIGATTTPNRQEPGRLPFIQVIATSDTPQNAINLAQQTAAAFSRFVQQQQRQRDIPSDQRLVIKQLRKPAQTFEVGGTSMNLPILIFLALVAFAVAVAYLLDRLFPRRPEAAVDEDGLPQRDDSEQPLVAASRRKA